MPKLSASLPFFRRTLPSVRPRFSTLATAFLLLACVGGTSFAAPPEAEPSEPDAPEAVRTDLSFTLPAGQRIDVDNPHGNVFLRFGGYEHQLDIRATVQQPDGAPEYRFAPGPQGGVFRVAPGLAEGAVPAATQRIDLVLYVPEGHPLQVRTLDGAIESRGVRGDVDYRSLSGEIAARGTTGTLQAASESGKVRVMLEPAAAGSRQRLSTRTGDISIGVSDRLGAEMRLSTSGSYTTDYSLQIEHRDGEEPGKRAQARIGVVKGTQPGSIEVESLRGNVRLWRRTEFVDAPAPEGEGARD